MKETIDAKKLLKQIDLTVNKELIGPFLILLPYFQLIPTYGLIFVFKVLVGTYFSNFKANIVEC